MNEGMNLLTFPDGQTIMVSALQISKDHLVCITEEGRFEFGKGKLQQADHAADALILNFGVYPYHCLRIRNQDDKQSIRKLWNHAEIQSAFRSGTRFFLWFTLAGMAAIIAIIAAAYLWVIPNFSSYVASKVSIETEREIGAKLFEGVQAQYKADTALTLLCKSFFYSLHYPGAEKMELMVVEAEDTNAFAMPGGYMVVFKGILHKTQSADQLAALLGHEYAHVRYRHSLRNLITASTGALLLSFLTGDLSGTVGGVLLSQAHEFRNLAYSRGLETEADEMGMEMMAASGANPAAMAEMLRQIQPSGTGEMPAFMSTHPVFSERIPHAKEYARKLKIVENKQNYKIAYDQLKAKLK
jgi:predicted Zn-dependent protease